MKFWKLETGYFFTSVTAIVVAETKEAAVLIAAADEGNLHDAEFWGRGEITEVVPESGMVLLVAEEGGQ